MAFYSTFKKQNQENLVASAKENSIFMESVRAILPLKTFGKETQRENIWQNAYVDKLNSTIRIGKLGFLYRLLNHFVFGLENVIVEYRMVSLHLERVADIVLAEPEPNMQGDPAMNVKGAVRTEGLAFRYSDSDPYIFSDLNITVEAGEAVAIVGRSGCGKTTLIKVLLRLLAPSSGRVLIDGVE